MKAFLCGLGMASEIGIFTLIFVVLWIFTSIEALEILVIDCAASSIISLALFMKIERILQTLSKKNFKQ